MITVYITREVKKSLEDGPEIKTLEELVEEFVAVDGVERFLVSADVADILAVGLFASQTEGVSTRIDGGRLVEQLVAELALQVLDGLQVLLLQATHELHPGSVLLQFLQQPGKVLLVLLGHLQSAWQVLL